MNESLLAKPYIQYNLTAWGEAIVNTYLVDNNIQTKLACKIDSLESIVLMVRREMGISLMPIGRGLEEMGDNIKVLPISGKNIKGKSLLFLTDR
jgi:DNA-binding transcriptional LysR family regulator